MKLKTKIALSIITLAGVLFGIGGGLLIGSDFRRNVDDWTNRGIDLHNTQKYQLRKELAQKEFDGADIHDFVIFQTGRILDEAAGGYRGGSAIVGEGYAALHNSLPADFSKDQLVRWTRMSPLGYQFHQSLDRQYLVFCSPVFTAGRSLWLITALDISAAVENQKVQTQIFYIIFGVILAALIVLANIAAAWITRPLLHLSKTSQEIAGGTYSRRTHMIRDDEIGALAQNFDKMADAIEAQISQLEGSVRQREDFMGAFTHELKTPMTAMMGYASLLKKGDVSPAQQQKALDYIHSETKRLEHLSQNMLQLLGLSDAPLVLGPVNLAEVFADVANALPETEDCEVVLPDPPQTKVLADAPLLADLLINLVRNGIGSQPRDGLVRVLCESEEDGCVITVADTGTGMDPETLRRAGEPFYRADQSRARKENGTGLGLSICAKIAELHGSHLAIESAPQKGTRVAFRLLWRGNGNEEETQ